VSAPTGWPHGRSRDGGIDEIPLSSVSGRLWLAGKHAVAPDVEGALARIGATTVVCLNERHELDDRYPDYVAWLVAERGPRALWHPIPDLHAPELREAAVLVDELLRRLALGHGLLVHCGAGFGRAGTTAACVLVMLGAEPDEAIDVVAAHRPMAGPEAGSQRLLVEAMAERPGRLNT
jgi:protein-tyrosine phosphatase